MGHKDDGQVDAPRCRNNDAVKMLLKDTIKIKRPINASLLFSRDFKKTAMENNDKRLGYKAAPPEARSAWEKLSEQEKEPYIKEYRRRYMEWKKSYVMAPQLDDTPPEVYTTPGQGRLKGNTIMRTEAPGVDTKIQKDKMMQNPVKEVDCQPDKQRNGLLSSGGMIKKTDRLLNVQQNLEKATNGQQRNILC